MAATLAQPAFPAAKFPLESGESVATCFSDFINPADPSTGINGKGFVVAITDIRDPLGKGAQPGLNWLAPMYHNEMPNPTNNPKDVWSAENLGQVFGLALDDAQRPNIYVGAASVYTLQIKNNAFAPNLFGVLGPGGVYRLDGTTGAICTFATLPNSGPGLGNIAYDRGHKQLFVSNLEDGLIYRLPATGGGCFTLTLPSSTFDHGKDGRPKAGLSPIVDDGLQLDITNPDQKSGFTQRLRRVWGLQVLGNRLFYGLWNEDEGHPSNSEQNEIWSVALNPATGDFDLNDVRREIQIPSLTLQQNPQTYSNPPSDIAFSASGKMLLAERVRSHDYGQIFSNAHRARVLEYSGVSPSWGNAKQFFIGNYFTNTNSAGGVDYGFGYVDDNGDGRTDRQVCDATVVATGDALRFPNSNPDSLQPSTVYGLQLTPGAGNVANSSPPSSSAPNSVGKSSIFVDLNPPNFGSADKTQIGDVEVFREECLPPPPPCMRTLINQVLCETDSSGKPTGNYTWQFRFQNLSGMPIYHLFLTDLPTGVSVDQDHFVFPGGISGLSPLIKVTFHGAHPGPLSFKLSIHDQTLAECCSIMVTLDLPPCDCAQVVGETAPGCFFPVPPPFKYSFNVQNLSSIKVENILLAAVSPVDHLTPIPTSQITVNKDVLPVPPITTGNVSGTKSVSISGPGATAGKEVCLRISVHDTTLIDCCSIVRCFRLPDCTIRFDDVYPVGSGTLTPFPPGFRIDNIGSSGDDGAGLLLHGAQAVEMAWRPLDAQGTLPNGAFFEVRAAGTGGQGTGKVRVTQVDSRYRISPDIGGSATYRVEVFKGDQPVETVSGVAAINVIVIWPIGAGAEVTRSSPDGTGTLSFTLTTDREIPWEIAGRPAIAGDRIRISPEHSTADVRSLDRFELRAANIPSITVTGVSVSSDCNANGVPDGEDIAAGTSADLDADGLPDECETPGGTGADLDLSLNTGFDQATGAALPPGSSDDDWRVVNTSTPGPAKVVIQPPAAWPAPLTDSGWISVDANRGRSVPRLDTLQFESCFCIDTDATAADLDLQLRADDSARVLLNGSPIGGPGGSFREALPLAIRLNGAVGGSGPFRAGQNCLRVEVNDSGRRFTGLDLIGTIRAARGACGARGATTRR